MCLFLNSDKFTQISRFPQLCKTIILGLLLEDMHLYVNNNNNQTKIKNREKITFLSYESNKPMNIDCGDLTCFSTP